MSIPWPAIAESLRAELAEYGELLRLFEAQQQSLFHRQPDEVLRYANEIEAQAGRLSEFREKREKIVSDFAADHGRPVSSSLRSMLGLIEADARPLLEALINEVNALLHRVRRTSRHNHTLLSRTVDLHQQTLELLRPSSFVKTYSPGGRVSVASATPAMSTLRATG
ncbi:MAG TPA: flagellar protein FlgN [Opitutaceae bacterium]|nr:flagellar protein FlgN [Opitutaceae bacterium]